MEATLTLRTEDLPKLPGVLINNIFTHWFGENTEITPEQLEQMQDQEKPLAVVIITPREDYKEYQAFITSLTDKSVQFLLFE